MWSQLKPIYTIIMTKKEFFQEFVVNRKKRTKDKWDVKSLQLKQIMHISD